MPGQLTDLKPRNMYKYRITLEYDGTNYHGWQAQHNARSIQGTLMATAERVLGDIIEVQGAGRTDAGVHALAQVAHLVTAKRLPPHRLQGMLNDALPAGINILKVDEADPDFHARHRAKARSYLYLISKRRTAFGKRYVWWVRDNLRLKEMEAATELFRGFHDFASFADRRRERDLSTMVMVNSCEIKDFGDLILIRIVASHFLWKMVRRIVGVTVEAGRGNLSLDEIIGMLENISDVPARNTAPPSGLFLERVLYEGDTLGSLHRPSFPFRGL
jgi:tRNA pseudouridine38-40 synthase